MVKKKTKASKVPTKTKEKNRLAILGGGAALATAVFLILKSREAPEKKAEKEFEEIVASGVDVQARPEGPPSVVMPVSPPPEEPANGVVGEFVAAFKDLLAPRGAEAIAGNGFVEAPVASVLTKEELFVGKTPAQIASAEALIAGGIEPRFVGLTPAEVFEIKAKEAAAPEAPETITARDVKGETATAAKRLFEVARTGAILGVKGLIDPIGTISSIFMR